MSPDHVNSSWCTKDSTTLFPSFNLIVSLNISLQSPDCKTPFAQVGNLLFEEWLLIVIPLFRVKPWFNSASVRGTSKVEEYVPPPSVVPLVQYCP